MVHARGDRRVPYEEAARLLVGFIPGARFVSLDTGHHILLPQESADRWATGACREDRGNAIARIFQKLQVESRSQAIVFAPRHGLGQD